MKYLYILLFAVLLVSCKKALDLHPLDSLTPDQAFSTDQNMQLYVNSFYNSGIPGASATFTGDGTMSDIQSINTVPTYLTGVFTSQQASGWDWGALRNINYFLAHYNTSSAPQDRKNNSGHGFTLKKLKTLVMCPGIISRYRRMIRTCISHRIRARL